MINSDCDNNREIRSAEILAPRRLKKNNILRVKKIERRVLPINRTTAIIPNINAWVWNVRFEICKKRKTESRRESGLEDWTPVTESAPRSPMTNTPRRSKAPINTCKTETAIILRWSPGDRTLTERPIVLDRQRFWKIFTYHPFDVVLPTTRSTLSNWCSIRVIPVTRSLKKNKLKRMFEYVFLNVGVKILFDQCRYTTKRGFIEIHTNNQFKTSEIVVNIGPK